MSDIGWSVVPSDDCSIDQDGYLSFKNEWVSAPNNLTITLVDSGGTTHSFSSNYGCGDSGHIYCWYMSSYGLEIKLMNQLDSQSSGGSYYLTALSIDDARVNGSRSVEALNDGVLPFKDRYVFRTEQTPTVKLSCNKDVTVSSSHSIRYDFYINGNSRKVPYDFASDAPYMTGVAVDGMSEIGDKAFSGCSRIELIDFSCRESGFIIGEYAFASCGTNASSVYVEFEPYGTITAPSITIRAHAFDGVKNIRNSDSSLFYIPNGTLYEYSFANATFVGNAISFKNMSTNTVIGAHAFENCSLTSIEGLDDVNIDRIGDSAFRNNKLSGLSVNASTVNDNAFMVDTEGTDSFNLTLGNRISSIGSKAFYNLGKMHITCKMSYPPTIQADSFNNVEEIIFSNSTVMNRYKTATNWVNFSDKMKVVTT